MKIYNSLKTLERILEEANLPAPPPPSPICDVNHVMILSGSEHRYRNFIRRSAEIQALTKKPTRVYGVRDLHGRVGILLLVFPAWNHAMSRHEEQELREMLHYGKATRGWTILYLTEKQELCENPIAP